MPIPKFAVMKVSPYSPLSRSTLLPLFPPLLSLKIFQLSRFKKLQPNTCTRTWSKLPMPMSTHSSLRVLQCPKCFFLLTSLKEFRCSTKAWVLHLRRNWISVSWDRLIVFWLISTKLHLFPPSLFSRLVPPSPSATLARSSTSERSLSSWTSILKCLSLEEAVPWIRSQPNNGWLRSVPLYLFSSRTSP